MRTPEQVESFRAQLADRGLSLSSPRSHSAVGDFKEGVAAEQCLDAAVKFEAASRAMWCEIALDPWCKRHNLTREQALSVLFDDSPFNAANPQKNLITRADVFAWSGQQNDFAAHMMQAAKTHAAPSTQSLLLACIQSGEAQEAESFEDDHAPELAPAG